MYQSEGLAAFQAEQKNKTPTTIGRIREIPPLHVADDVFLHDHRIVAQRCDAKAWHGSGDDVCHVSRLVEIRRNLVAYPRAVYRNATRLFGKGALHGLDALGHLENLFYFIVADQKHSGRPSVWFLQSMLPFLPLPMP